MKAYSHYPHRNLHTTKTIPNINLFFFPLEREVAYLPLESGTPPPHLCIVSSSPLTTSTNVRGELSWSWCSVSFLCRSLWRGRLEAQESGRASRKEVLVWLLPALCPPVSWWIMNEMLQEPPTPSLILSWHVLAPPGLNQPAIPQQRGDIQNSKANHKHSEQWIPRTSPRRIRPL